MADEAALDNNFNPSWCALGQVMDALVADKALGAKLLAPSVSYGAENLYMRGPLEEATRGNLARACTLP